MLELFFKTVSFSCIHTNLLYRYCFPVFVSISSISLFSVLRYTIVISTMLRCINFYYQFRLGLKLNFLFCLLFYPKSYAYLWPWVFFFTWDSLTSTLMSYNYYFLFFGKKFELLSLCCPLSTFFFNMYNSSNFLLCKYQRFLRP